MAELTEAQREALAKAKNGPAKVPSLTASKLWAAGLARKADQRSGERGFSVIEITDEGRAALAA